LLAWVIVGAVSTTSFAQAPLGATGQCNDGSYSMMESKQAGCGKHGGVREWYENNRAPDKSANTLSSEATKTGDARSALPAPTGKSTRAAGGGRELAKAQTSSKADHCDKSNGKTTKNETTNEAEAKPRADRAGHGKACS
jgi:hypothetical protein